MLDRIDAMLFAIPVVWAFRAWQLLQLPPAALTRAGNFSPGKSDLTDS